MEYDTEFAGTHSRSTDPDTSHAGAADVAGRAPKQWELLLEQYRNVAPGGLTDEEASDLANLPSGWKRCSDLRNKGLIAPMRAPDGTAVTRMGSHGSMVMVCALV